MANNESIKDTLEVIRRALEDESDFSKKNDNVLILDKKINDDGTVKMLGQPNNIDEINNVIEKKLSNLLEKKLSDMLENQLPNILDKYFKNKK